MAINKSTEFTEDIQVLAEFAKAIAHPARIEILRVLAEKNQCICGEIVEVMPLSQSTVSQHLKALKKAGIIQGEVEGVRSCYCSNWDNLNKALSAFNTYFGNIRKISNCC